MNRIRLQKETTFWMLGWVRVLGQFVISIVSIVRKSVVGHRLSGTRCRARLIPRIAGRRIGVALGASGVSRAVPLQTLRVVSGQRTLRGLSLPETGQHEQAE